MHMIDAPHTLQADPILEPHHPLPGFLTTYVSLSRQGIDETPADKLLYQSPRLGRNVASIIVHRYRRPRPDDDVLDALLKTIRPVVQEDGIVSTIFKRQRRMMRERVSSKRLIVLRRPEQSFPDNKVCDGTVGLFRLVRPTEVLVQVRRQAFQLLQLVICL